MDKKTYERKIKELKIVNMQGVSQELGEDIVREIEDMHIDFEELERGLKKCG